MIPFDVAMMHRAIQTHYNSDTYDYFKFKGRIRMKGSTFDNDPNRFHYSTLMKRFERNHENIEMFFVANLYYNPNVYIGDLLNDTCTDIFYAHLKSLDSLSYNFKNDIGFLRHTYSGKINLLFKGSDPIIIQVAQQKTISRYSFVALDYLLGFTAVMKPADTIIWPQHKKLLTKFSKFVVPYMDIPRLRTILLETYR